MRILAISDLHVDFPESAQWVQNLSSFDFMDDVLIVAGDISDDLGRLRLAFEKLAKIFSMVLYVPGNHELWVQKCGHSSSFEKFDSVSKLADMCGVSMKPFHVPGVSVIPMLGWYDYSFGNPGEELVRQWMDYRFCEWQGKDDETITDYFTDMNPSHIEQNDNLIITFSHFLPRIDIMPSYIPEKFRFIYPVLGTSILDRQIRQLGSKIHIYGHSHVNLKVQKDGVLYINSAFGSPSERHICAKTMQCVYEA